MRFESVLTLVFLLIPIVSHAGCIPFADAGKHIGETRCISGKLLKIERDQQGTTRLNFCEVSQTCPFVVIVPQEHLAKVGDLQQFQGKTLEIHGRVKESDGRAEIVLQKPGQLVTDEDDEAVPTLLQAYDVEEKGHYSAGTSRAPKSKRVTTKKQTATLPIDVPADAGSSDER
jgi:DNA/RNA endonuclease YhcR with UshA esterase domain